MRARIRVSMSSQMHCLALGLVRRGRPAERLNSVISILAAREAVIASGVVTSVRPTKLAVMASAVVQPSGVLLVPSGDRRLSRAGEMLQLPIQPGRRMPTSLANRCATAHVSATPVRHDRRAITQVSPRRPAFRARARYVVRNPLTRVRAVGTRVEHSAIGLSLKKQSPGIYRLEIRKLARNLKKIGSRSCPNNSLKKCENWLRRIGRVESMVLF